MKRTAIFLITLAIMLVGTAVIFGQNRQLADTEWKLIEANGRPVTNSSASITINEDGTKFTGNTGCNRMFGTLVLRGRNIDFQDVGVTKMMCKLMPGNIPERVFLSALEKAVSYRQSGATLRLMDRRGQTVLAFSGVPREGQNSTRLQDKKWVLEQIKGRQTFVPLPYAFVNFDARKGSVGGNSGCNVFGGNYSTRGGTVTISNIIATMRACVEDSKMAVERDMLDGLRSARRFEIKNGRLILYRGGDLLLTFRGENK